MRRGWLTLRMQHFSHAALVALTGPHTLSHLSRVHTYIVIMLFCTTLYSGAVCPTGTMYAQTLYALIPLVYPAICFKSPSTRQATSRARDTILTSFPSFRTHMFHLFHISGYNCQTLFNRTLIVEARESGEGDAYAFRDNLLKLHVQLGTTRCNCATETLERAARRCTRCSP